MTWWPLISTGLLTACLVLYLTRSMKPVWRTGGFLLALTISMVPFGDYSLAHYLRPLTGDLSIATCLLLLIYASEELTRHVPDALSHHRHRYYLGAGFISLLLYPSALGVTLIDLYSHGFYPVTLLPLLLAAFAVAVYRRWYIIAVILALGFGSWQFSLLESDNLWDYLLDPLLAGFSIVYLIRRARTLRLDTGLLTEAGWWLIIACLFAGLLLDQTNLDAFRHQFAVEDGLLETLTVLALATGAAICITRLRASERIARPMHSILLILFLFAIGEELSWGQRLLDYPTPEFFLELNKQQEVGLHNLVFTLNGMEISINRLVFGTGLAIGLSIFLFVVTPLYRTNPTVRSHLDGWGIPMPTNSHIACYLLIVLVSELLIQSPKRGELIECTGTLLFVLQLFSPANAIAVAARIHRATD